MVILSRRRGGERREDAEREIPNIIKKSKFTAFSE